jgi:hypothetical protein
MSIPQINNSIGHKASGGGPNRGSNVVMFSC